MSKRNTVCGLTAILLPSVLLGAPAAAAANRALPQDTQRAAPATKKLEMPPVDTSKLPKLVRVRFEELRRKLDSEPADLERVVTAAAMLYVHGSPTDAVAYLEKALQLTDQYAELYHILGIFTEKAGDPAKAAQRYQKALDLEPKAAPSAVRLALLIIDKDPAKARTLLEQALAEEKNDPRALCGLARCLAGAGDKDGAIDALRKALALFPAYKEANERLAALLTEQGKADEAAVHKKIAAAGVEAPYVDYAQFKVLELGLDVQTLIQIANRIAADGDVARAESVLTQAIDIEGAGTSARAALALIKYQTGKYDEAVSMLNSIISAVPDDPQRRAQLGETLFRAGRVKEALAAFKKASELSPTEGRYHYWVALASFRQNDLDAALVEFQKAAELSPNLPEAHVGYAQLASQKKQYDVAKKAFEQGLRDIPDSTLIQNAAAWFMATIPSDAHRNPKEAVRLAELACKATENKQHEFLDTLAAAYASDGRFDDAVARMNDAIARVDEALKAAKDAPTRDRLTGLKKEYESRLKLYSEKTPFREESK